MAVKLCEPISVASTVYLAARVFSVVETGTQPVWMALMADTSTPEDPADWETAIWDPDNVTALLLVGPDSPFGTVTPGRYFVWVKVDDNPEEPVMYAGVQEFE
jgi:hypothetical protein